MNTATIANAWDGMYAAITMPKKSDTTAAERAALEKRVRAGEWLRIGDAAKVLDVGRTKMHTLASRGAIGYRTEPGSRYRLCKPEDIIKLLDDARQERRGEPVSGEAGPAKT